MKNILKNIAGFILVLSLFSCTTEEENIEYFTKDSEEVGIIERMTQLPFKNSVYGENHNFGLIYPFKAKKIDNTQNPPIVTSIIISDTVDYKYYNYNGLGSGMVGSIFTNQENLPVKVVMRDYTVRDITTLQDAEILFENNQKFPIKNIQFKTPLLIKNKEENYINILSNVDLFQYVNKMQGEKDYFDFCYPISMIKNNQTITVQNNGELRQILNGI